MKKRGPQLTRQDQNKTFRTRLVGVWLISNAALAISITSINGLDQTQQMVQDCLPSGDEVMVQLNKTCLTQAISLDSKQVQSKQQEYFKYLLWATFGLSAIRFIGVSLLMRMTAIPKLTSSACTTGRLDSSVVCGGGTRWGMGD